MAHTTGEGRTHHQKMGQGPVQGKGDHGAVQLRLRDALRYEYLVERPAGAANAASIAAAAMHVAFSVQT